MPVVENSDPGTRLESQPLYAQVKDALVQRMISGSWKPGQMLPSEFAIAADLGVSQGTVRKALDELAGEGVVVRRQGRGTFVAAAEDNSILFRFYRLVPDGPTQATGFPNSRYLSQIITLASEQEREIFALSEQDQVMRFERLRSDQQQILLWERLVLPCPRFPNLSESSQLPNNVYQFYGERYGIIVASVREQLRAVTAPPAISAHLGLPPGAPVLQIDRRAIALDGEIVEWRVSLCRSDTMHYRNELR